MAEKVAVLGVISDTHGLLREEALEALAGCGLIIHAGDVGKPEILDQLRAVAPVIAVRGNVDTGVWASQLPCAAVVEAGPARIYVLHDIHEMQVDPADSGFDIVISGHSHKRSHGKRFGIIYLNPGSAGPQRFNRVRDMNGTAEPVSFFVA
jgi:uncharacterized protein